MFVLQLLIQIGTTSYPTVPKTIRPASFQNLTLHDSGVGTFNFIKKGNFPELSYCKTSASVKKLLSTND